MTQIYFFNNEFVKVTTEPQEALNQFLNTPSISKIGLPDCRQLDMAWELSDTPETDAKLRLLVEPVLNRLKDGSWAVIPYEKTEIVDRAMARERWMGRRTRSYNSGWLHQVKDSPHFPADFRQLAADLSAEFPDND